MFNLRKESALCSSGEHRSLLIAHGVLWATLTIAVALVSKATSTAPAVFQWLLTLVLLPGWLASERILRRALRAQPAGGGCP